METDERTVCDISTTASSPRSFSTHGDDEKLAQVEHIRQSSTCTADGFDAEEVAWRGQQTADSLSMEECEAPATRSHTASVDIIEFELETPNSLNKLASDAAVDSPSLKLPNVYMIQVPMVYGAAPIIANNTHSIVDSTISMKAPCPTDPSTILSTSLNWHERSRTATLPACRSPLSTHGAWGSLAGASTGNAAEYCFYQQGAQPIRTCAAYTGYATLNDTPSGSSTPPEATKCQVFWCDPRSFKETSMKDQLESKMNTNVKCYRTADMCMRLLRKKQHFQSKSNFRLFLVSWSNAPALVSFLEEEQFLVGKVIVLCDTCGGKGCSKASAWAQQHPSVEVAYKWEQAVDFMLQYV